MSTFAFRDGVLETLAPIGDFFARSMMGEYCLYYNGRLVGDLCEDQLLVKDTPTARRLLAEHPRRFPYPGSRQLMFVVEDYTDTEKMRALFNGMWEEVPPPKGKKA